MTDIELTDRERWQLAHGRPVPARITQALDLRGLEGPEVDEQVGTWEGRPLAERGDVDDWEAARSTPRPEQVLLLAKLTRMPVAWFYQPVTPGEQLGGVWIRWANRRAGRRCEWVPPDVVDDRGVLHRGGQEPAEAPDVQPGLFPVSGMRTEPAPRAPRPPAKTEPVRRAAPSRTPARSGAEKPPALLPRTRMSDADRAMLTEKIAEARRVRETRSP